MNVGDSYKRRRKERFADEDSCSDDHDHVTSKEDSNVTDESSSNEEDSTLYSTTHKRKARNMPEFHSEDRMKRIFASVNQTEAQSPNAHENQPGSGQRSWWDECSRPDYPEVEFKKAFRMSKSTFQLICFELNSVIGERNGIPVKQRVAVCIFWLATGEPLWLVSKRFGLCISTCRNSVIEVCSAITGVLMPKYLRWPDAVSLRKIKEEFEYMSWIPNVVGSMYTTHIPITPPETSVVPAAAYFNKRQTERNRKTSHSVTIQGVVDPNGVFTDVSIGWPGSMNDDQVLKKSALYQRANDGLIKGVWWVVGSKGYPLMDWILVPYNKKHLTWTQYGFNEKIEEIQGVAKDAFGRLKGRWCCLQKKSEIKVEELTVVIGACCVLHNVCELMGEGFDPDPDFESVDDDDGVVPEIGSRSMSSLKARDAIAHNLLHHQFRV